MEKACKIAYKTASTILQSLCLELITIVIVINVLIGRSSGEGLKWLVHAILR